MRELDEVLRLKRAGVRFDEYLNEPARKHSG
jgi:hypothetical protein